MRNWLLKTNRRRLRQQMNCVALGIVGCASACLMGLLPVLLSFALAFAVLPVGMVVRGTRTWTDKFDRAQAFTTTPGQNGWTIKDTSSAGTPTYLCVSEDGGSAKLTIANNSEEEIVTLYHNDVTQFDLALLKFARFVVKVGSIDAVTTLVFGLASAQNDTEDSVATNCWFRMEGSASTSAVVVETDDGVTDNDDKATGASLAAVYKECYIDFTNGLSDIHFFIDGQRVASGTTFSMTGVTAGTNVQPFVQLHKASGTGTPNVQIALVELGYNYALGA